MKTIFILILISVSLSCFSQQKPKCQAKTKQGYACSRNAVKEGYCTQHYKMLSASTKADSLLIFTGAKGGKYYIKNGVKHYIKK